MVLTEFKDDVLTDQPEPIPAEVAMVMSALEAGTTSEHLESRRMRRFSYRTAGQIRLFRDGPTTPGRLLYTRDINRRGVGFVTAHRLPLGYGGVLQLADENGRTTDVHCTLLRCREAAPGWFEGSAVFNRDQPQFDR
jgi:hypothetical protein